MPTLSAIDLEDYFDRVVSDSHNFPSFAIGARISIDERVIELTDRAIPIFQAEAISEAHKDLAKYKHVYENSDIAYWRESLELETAEVIPTAFRGSAVIAMAAAHEQCLNDLSSYIKRRRTASEIFNLLGDKANKTLSPGEQFRRLVQLETIGDAPTEQGITAMVNVRNSIAHASGLLTGDNARRVAALRNLAAQKSGVTIQNDRVVVTLTFLRGSISCIVKQLNAAMRIVIEQYPT